MKLRWPKTVSPRIAVFEHALPHRILLEELKQNQSSVSPEEGQPLGPEDAAVVKKTEAAYGKLEAEKNALDDWSTKNNSAWLPRRPAQKSDQDSHLEAVRQAQQECKTCEQAVTTVLHKADRSALCFSGGGIRSAGICLGVLQGLARFSTRGKPGTGGMLHTINFLSTVSGGGYIGSWFMAWARRHPHGYAGAVADTSQRGLNGVDPEPSPVRHLREYTSFLAPRLGGLTVDTWTLLATVIRNLFLNSCMLLPGAAALLCVPILFGIGMYNLGFCPAEYHWIGGFVVLLSVALLLLAIVQFVSRKWAWQKLARWLMGVADCVVSLAVAGVVVYWRVAQRSNVPLDFDWKTIREFALFVAIPLLIPAFYGIVLVRRKTPDLWDAVLHCSLFVMAVPFVALSTSSLLLLLAQLAPVLENAVARLPTLTAYAWRGDAWAYVLGIPLVWAALLTASSLFTGIVAKGDLEENREWWARMKATHMLLMMGWFGISALAFYGPALFHWFIGLLTLGTGAVAALAGKSPSTPAGLEKAAKSHLNVVASVFGLLFLFFLAITLAFVNRSLVDILAAHYPELGEGEAWGLYAAALLGFAIVCNCFFSVNTFSLHHMYRSRLMRAFLGASNELRNPDFFTNFDPGDNLRESELPKGANSPLHIINATLNLVATTNTAWTQRKAESFTFSPLHCGSLRVGYVPTEQYAARNGVTLATAMAISGAAFNPNMGYHSSPLLTLIMTLFNVRLGYWLPNPRLNKSASFFRNSSPRLALVPLISEALGNTNDRGNFIQVSDGGHFENLALYEMVMRRCHRIVVVDGGADPKFELEDLGNAVRKIRIDLGIQIEFRDDNHIRTGNKPESLYCAIADIRYKEIDGPDASDGELIYLKPAVRGSETIDIQHYAATHSDFPNQTTADQFFNEAQFESYRKLGMTMVEKIVAAAPDGTYTTADFFKAAETYS